MTRLRVESEHVTLRDPDNENQEVQEHPQPAQVEHPKREPAPSRRADVAPDLARRPDEDGEGLARRFD